jgi:LPXTG-motif cell wall-anchored protein
MPAQSVQEPQVVALKTTPLKAQQPTEEEVEISEVFAAPAPAPAQLPKTASGLPFIGVVGLLSLSGALLLRRKMGKVQ